MSNVHARYTLTLSQTIHVFNPQGDEIDEQSIRPGHEVILVVRLFNVGRADRYMVYVGRLVEVSKMNRQVMGYTVDVTREWEVKA